MKLYDVRRILGVNFSIHVLAKTATMQRINAPSIFNLMSSILASLYKIIDEDENRPGEFRNSAPIIFYESNSAVLYAANEDFSSNASRKLKTISIKNRQDGITAQMVLKLIHKIQMA